VVKESGAKIGTCGFRRSASRGPGAHARRRTAPCGRSPDACPPAARRPAGSPSSGRRCRRRRPAGCACAGEVLGLQVLDLRLGALVERVVGVAQVGELGVAAPAGLDHAMQHRIGGARVHERAVAVPQLVGEVRQVLGRVALGHVALRVDVGDVDQALVLQPLGPLEHALEADVQRAEGLGEVDLLLRRQRLAAEDQHAVLVHAGVDGAHVGVRQRLGEVDAAGLGGEHGMQGLELQGHGALRSLLFDLRFGHDAAPRFISAAIRRRTARAARPRPAARTPARFAWISGLASALAVSAWIFCSTGLRRARRARRNRAGADVEAGHGFRHRRVVVAQATRLSPMVAMIFILPACTKGRIDRKGSTTRSSGRPSARCARARCPSCRRAASRSRLRA
jgi:hypothetical protein